MSTEHVMAPIPAVVTAPGALRLCAGPYAATAARRWVDREAAQHDVPRYHRPHLRLVCTELVRDAVTCARSGEPVQVAVGFDSGAAMLSVSDPTRTRDLSHRCEVVVRLAGEWGIQWPRAGGRRVWCRVDLR